MTGASAMRRKNGWRSFEAPRPLSIYPGLRFPGFPSHPSPSYHALSTSFPHVPACISPFTSYHQLRFDIFDGYAEVNNRLSKFPDRHPILSLILDEGSHGKFR
ncbi:hypothetical protein VKT23_020105 [Stygiomarasmius scandens]|uniref:Uncharacterized protein n=1 Tax=Marasmiellus scandens TaxID=2682957 RepID=A0ABR1IK17_9AGAR